MGAVTTTRRALGAVALGALVASTLTGCFSAFYLNETAPILTARDVVGTWVATGPDGQVATIELREDGEAVVTGLPGNLNWDASISDDTVDWAETLDTDGTWTLRIQERDPITLIDIDAADQRCCALYAVGDDEGTHLVMTVSDPDAKIRAYFDQQE